MVKAKKYILVNRFNGLPKSTDFKLEEEELPPLQDGEFLVKAVYISVDPYMRLFAEDESLHKVFTSTQVGKIIESKSKEYSVGTYIVAECGWRTHTILNDLPPLNGIVPQWVIPNFKNLPLSLALGVLGMPGNSAYFGFLEICKPKAGETVVISGAGGAVGSHVGQIAKIKGCKVIGITGSGEKGKWLVEELNFDHFINYKEEDIKSKLKEYAPNGIDCYFDNVGGEISSTVISLMNLFGRISICGSSSVYNCDQDNLPKVTVLQGFMLRKQLTMKTFVVTKWLDKWEEGINKNLKWVEEGVLKYRETVTEGFENTFAAFLEMLQGKHIGKAIIKV